MATGLSFNGVCYATGNDALLAFNVQYPQVTSDHLVNLTSSSVAGSVLTYNLAVRPIDTNTITARSGTFTLMTCDTSTLGLTSYPIQDVLFVVAAVFILMIGYATGMKR